MRSVIRPAFVGLAVVGMAFAGAASAQADCPDDYPATDNASSVNIDDSFNTIEDSFNDTTITDSFNGSIIDGDVEIN
jgi:hypothetical protein